jgi:hypothetical protein
METRETGATGLGKHAPQPLVPPRGLEPSPNAGEQSSGWSAGNAAAAHGSGASGAGGGARRALQRESIESLLQAQRSVLLLNAKGAPGAVWPPAGLLSCQ